MKKTPIFFKRPVPTERIALFIDGSNFFETIKQLGIVIDYNAVKYEFENYGRIVRALYYTAVRTDENGWSDIRPTLDWMKSHGWYVVEKPARRYQTETGYITKGNMDVEITVDMLQMSQNWDHIYFFTGDGDYLYLIRAIQQQGIRVTVVSSRQTSTKMLSEDLRKQADDFIDLADIRHKIQKKDV